MWSRGLEPKGLRLGGLGGEGLDLRIRPRRLPWFAAGFRPHVYWVCDRMILDGHILYIRPAECFCSIPFDHGQSIYENVTEPVHWLHDVSRACQRRLKWT
jgi:hypothetical protein